MTNQTVVLPRESDDGFAHFKLSRDTWYIKFYLWLYGASPHRINTCKLLWAYAFAVLALPVRLLVSFVVLVGGAALSALPEREKKVETTEEFLARMQREREEREARSARGPSKAERWLDAFALKASSVYAKVAPVLKYVGIVLGVVIGGFVLYLVGSLAVNHTADFLKALLIAVIVVVWLGLLALFFAWIDQRESKRTGDPAFFTVVSRLVKGFHTHTCAKIDLG